jgi:hypothetical protein
MYPEAENSVFMTECVDICSSQRVKTTYSFDVQTKSPSENKIKYFVFCSTNKLPILPNYIQQLPRIIPAHK